MFYDDLFFEREMQRLATYFPIRGLRIDTKLVLIYGNRWVLFLFLVGAFLGLAVMIQRRRDLLRAIPPWGIPLMCAYCVLAGRFFFNQNEFFHAGPAQLTDPPMLRSLLVAVVPAAVLCLVNLLNTRRWREALTVRLAVIPLAHLVMTIVYLLSPYLQE
jgi:hypothetical protein